MVDLDGLAVDGFGHWFAGFVDGEGCFCIYGNARRFQCQCTIEVRGDERPILEEITDRLGFGQVRDLPPRRQDNLTVRWSVNSKAGCVRLIEVLDRFPLRAKKARDYAIWREAVSAWMLIRPSGPGRGADWAEMAVLRDALVAGRRFGAKPAPVPRGVPAQLTIV